MPRDGFVQIRADATERAKWQAEADAEGITLSDLIRRRMNEPDRVTRLQAQVDRMADDLATFQEFFRARRAAEPPIPQPESVTEGWEGQSDYQHKPKEAK